MAVRIYGNRSIKTLPGQDTRPTASRVREALFNIWQGEITGCRWLDLCAGSGAMGAEALCRGAAVVVGMEQSSRACRVIQQNWQQVAQPNQAFQVLRGDVLRLLPQLAAPPFDHIYFDPPYASGLYEPVLQAIAQHRLLAADGVLVAEHSANTTLPEAIALEPDSEVQPGMAMLVCDRHKRYGQTSLTFYRWEHNTIEAI
ncbi:MAG: 16S rRNA (guanine(966)-N(2))-methyltransferase RsmD [Elainellaceae cyanobacterium]